MRITIPRLYRINFPHLAIGSRFSTSIRCSSDLGRVEWYQGNNRVTSSGNLYLTHSGINNFVTTDDEGLQYRCLAISPYVTQEKSITYSVIGTSKHNSSISLTCNC